MTGMHQIKKAIQAHLSAGAVSQEHTGSVTVTKSDFLRALKESVLYIYMFLLD